MLVEEVRMSIRGVTAELLIISEYLFAGRNGNLWTMQLERDWEGCGW